MTQAAILLLILAAFLHASWNVVSKQRKPSAAFFLVANTVGCLMLLPLAIAQGAKYALFPSHVWQLVLLTGMFQAVYYASLASAYGSGDMTLAYPIARSSPVIVVTVVTLVLGQGDAVGRTCIMGIILVVTGCFMVPMSTFRDFRLRNYLCRTCMFALFAAFGTAGYSITDAEALGAIRSNLGEADSVVAMTILYAFVEALSASLFLAVYVMLRRRERTRLVGVLKRDRRVAAAIGVGIYLTYLLVLLSMSWVRNVSYVVGFRQLSIPVGVGMGFIFLKERVSRPKLVGVALLAVGLVLIAVEKG